MRAGRTAVNYSYSPNLVEGGFYELRQGSSYLAPSGDALRFCGEYAAFVTNQGGPQ